MYKRLGIALFLSTAALLAGCVDIPDYDDTPRITFNSIDKFFIDIPGQSRSDSLVIAIDFEDGDGDLGYNQNDSSSANPYEEEDWGNYRIRTMRWDGEKFEDYFFPALDGLKLYFPTLKPDGVSGPIRGTLDLGVAFPYGNSFQMETLKFVVQVRDRSLNASNEIETDSISLPVAQ